MHAIRNIVYLQSSKYTLSTNENTRSSSGILLSDLYNDGDILAVDDLRWLGNTSL